MGDGYDDIPDLGTVSVGVRDNHIDVIDPFCPLRKNRSVLLFDWHGAVESRCGVEHWLNIDDARISYPAHAAMDSPKS